MRLGVGRSEFERLCEGADRLLELAQRGVRFGDGGPQALELLRRVHEWRGEVELAAEAVTRAKSAGAPAIR